MLWPQGDLYAQKDPKPTRALRSGTAGVLPLGGGTQAREEASHIRRLILASSLYGRPAPLLWGPLSGPAFLSSRKSLLGSWFSTVPLGVYCAQSVYTPNPRRVTENMTIV